MSGPPLGKWFALSNLLIALTSAASFQAQIQRCPESCSNVNQSPTNWTTYHSFDHIDLCEETMLFDFNIFTPLLLGDAHATIRACTAAVDDDLSITNTSTCDSADTRSVTLQLASWESPASPSATASQILQIADALQYQLTAAECGEKTIVFGSQDDVLLGLYVGSGIDTTVSGSLLLQEVAMYATNASQSDIFAAQVCGDEYDGSQTMGLIVSTTGDYELLQSAMQSWAKASCITGYNSVVSSNITITTIPATASAKLVDVQNSQDALIQTRDTTCSYVLIVSGDLCGTLETECGITAAELSEYNPTIDCNDLVVGQPICCSSGDVPDLSPQEGSDGLCYSYTVQSGDYCSLLADEYYLTADEIEDYNAETWGWMGCDDLQLGAEICLSTGDPPMPAVISNAECGPQVSGTVRPSNWSDISSLNPCSLNACFFNIGYFEAFGVERPCLDMNASQLPSSYSHIHFAFGGITDDYQVDLSTSQDQFNEFVNMNSFKKILSFGAETPANINDSLDSYPIFRDSVSDANRLTFAQSLVSTVNEYDLDGVDFDWEYPDAPDIPGIPAGSATDGPDYLSFLTTLRDLLPSDKSISIAAPASYWYLKGFPIANMSEVLDYIVYMTYDLHGQWDYNNTFVNPGCPTGNCLRSHVNLTETEYALAMITKAGVPANKVVVGIASYGRSFGMEDSSCTGPECLFVGPDSTATEGDCTATAGYISQAELSEYITLNLTDTLLKRSVTTWHDDSSDSDIMLYGDDTWVAYMTNDTKSSRSSLYAGYNFLGTVDWAVDLVNFVDGEGITAADSNLNVTEAIEAFTEGLTLSNYSMVGTMFDANYSDLATRIMGFDGCSVDQWNQIYSGWQQSWKIMNYMYDLVNDDLINFNEGAAIEFLGPPALNQDEQAHYKDVFLNLATIQPAYTSNEDEKYKIARINFCCAGYFAMDTLDQAMRTADKGLGVDWYADLSKYWSNQAGTWIHELLHINWVSKADRGINPSIHDMKLRIADTSGKTSDYLAYGAHWTKVLAKWRINPGYWTLRNSESLSLYAMALYVQKALGNIYPHLPLAPETPINVGQSVAIPYLFEMFANGTAEITFNSTSEEDTVWSADEGACAAMDDQDYDLNTGDGYVLTLSADFAVQSDYPSDYLSSWSSWAGLATTTTTATTTASSAPSATATASWSIAIYSENDCAGDYYVLQGYNEDSPSNTCLVINDLTTTFSSTGVSCGWYTDGGETFTTCDKGTLTEPLSWIVVGPGAICTVYSTDVCTSFGDDAYDSTEGCHNYSSSDDDAQTWMALKCGLND
ncbi:glycoside hydrolase family 18 protein [Penicillium malachiteum]|uniref:chitinase n=1 Tax=Penicillium malachiteum TaxID=1324776 RepID=A0AAD6MQ60_9EURO|nr:glycoside hydrolase family 18 protein [Penicillium malachiteum]